ncbi:MAG: type VI secretion system baseplate subunit TssF [Marinomonas gallaica]
MKQALIDVYQKELSYLKRRGEAFAKEHPKIGARLHIMDDNARDPHVERIIQGVAFLNARIRKKLDDEFPELCQTLLDVIYPHYLRPLPSYNIISFEPEKNLTSVSHVPKGLVVEHSGQNSSELCFFKTIYDAQILPFKVGSARLQTCPVEAPNPGSFNDIKAVLSISLDAVNSAVEAEKLDLNTVRFYIKGTRHYSFALYELILNHSLKIAVAKGPHDPDAVFLDVKTALKTVGFEEDEGMLPYPEQSFIGYRLLTEYFAYPEKFLFFDVDVSTAQSVLEGQHIELYFYLDKALPDIEATVDKDNFVLNATPQINLFKKRSEPTLLDFSIYEYPVIADARHPDRDEIYNIDSLSISADGGNIDYISPFFGVSTTPDSELSDVRWHTRREELEQGNVRSLFHLSLINLEKALSTNKGGVFIANLTCSNGRLPYLASQRESQPNLVPRGGSAAISRVVSETPFTDTVRPRIDDDIYWQLLSHLNLNHISLTAGALGSNAFQKILSLYNFNETGENESVVNAVQIQSVSPSTMRILDDSGIPFFCRGSQVTLLLDESRFAGSSPYLFAAVLERFLGLYTQINSFVQLTVELQGREMPLCAWPPRSGDQALL